ncbi:SDR family NAD(P)-dependent oxidoreductase [Cardiobacteriales bacterium ML27]|uniref:SDR family NAD(P)-dependent oxidoreductase n=2 Tax=Ostreibacterium oceani TaxID=2654998 RepID=A0A6N7EYD8_9GAMM|nr:SDR family NAD(P)-dependent oxidoreductase [Ostreibacterium oceani]
MTTSTLTCSRSLSEKALPPQTLNRLRILITGCSSGIGYHCAKRLHEQGHIVVAACRQYTDVKRLQDEGLLAVQLDLDDSGSIVEGIRDCLAITHNILDVLINNGAYGQPGAVEDLTRATLEKQFSTNVFGTHELTSKLLKTLLASDCPRIIQISSVLGLVSLKYRGAYVASKYALEGLTDTMRLELADTAVKIVLVEPGPITSRFRENAQKAFVENVDTTRSRHVDAYKRAMRRFDSTTKQPFTLSEEAVYQVVIRAIQHPNPKPRYYVTKATYLLGYAKRILSTRLLDCLLCKISDDENKHSRQTDAKGDEKSEIHETTHQATHEADGNNQASNQANNQRDPDDLNDLNDSNDLNELNGANNSDGLDGSDDYENTDNHRSADNAKTTKTGKTDKK